MSDVFNPGLGYVVLVRYNPTLFTADVIEKIIRSKYPQTSTIVVHEIGGVHQDSLTLMRVEAIANNDLAVHIVPVDPIGECLKLSNEVDIVLDVSDHGYFISKWRGVTDYPKGVQLF